MTGLIRASEHICGMTNLGWGQGKFSTFSGRIISELAL